MKKWNALHVTGERNPWIDTAPSMAAWVKLMGTIAEVRSNTLQDKRRQVAISSLETQNWAKAIAAVTSIEWVTNDTRYNDGVVMGLETGWTKFCHNMSWSYKSNLGRGNLKGTKGVSTMSAAASGSLLLARALRQAGLHQYLYRKSNQQYANNTLLQTAALTCKTISAVALSSSNKWA